MTEVTFDKLMELRGLFSRLESRYLELKRTDASKLDTRALVRTEVEAAKLEHKMQVAHAEYVAALSEHVQSEMAEEEKKLAKIASNLNNDSSTAPMNSDPDGPLYDNRGQRLSTEKLAKEFEEKMRSLSDRANTGLPRATGGPSDNGGKREYGLDAS